MFADPQTVTVNAVAKTLPRVDVGNRRAIYESAADGLVFTLTHVKGKRNRHTVRLDINKTAADPLLDGVSKVYSMSAYLIVDAPDVGFTLAEQKLNVKALTDWFGTSTNTDKVLAFES
jgi:hypothetical protein